ncbi:MAG: hypothetical protein ACM3YO_08490 [Bacteroidota bacterium]
MDSIPPRQSISIPPIQTSIQAAVPKAAVEASKPAGQPDRFLGSEPATRVSEELSYREKPGLFQKMRDWFESGKQSKRADLAPGKLLCRNSHGGKQGIRQLRDASKAEQAIPSETMKKTEQGWEIPSIKNPYRASGKFDPYEFLPNLAFSPQEDSFPVIPDGDGDGKVKTDASHYQHGVIGGNQPLKGSVSVAKKGEYTVLTYSLFYVDNKFTNYHLTDSSTFSVYLKPDRDGNLKPESLYTSSHYGGNLTKWEDLQKGADGRPVILVERGSHALHPYGKDEEIPSKGLQVRGNGQAMLDGKKLSNKMSWVSPQANFENTERLDPVRDKVQFNAYYEKYPERTNPIHPILWKD